MDNYIEKRLDGRYLIKELIGAGGMANVYKAIDLKDNRVVAVKILKEECMSNEELVRRFKNESKAIAVLNHPCIVKVYDVSVSDKLQYIVMEYIDGITLKEYMEYRKEALTYKETLHFVTQILGALQHAHQKGIVHRDIKPQNIMLLADGNIRVTDFGIARFSRSENKTMTDKAIGSVHYISPEQAKGDTTDAKADLYSVGVMMYEMLSGKLPFDSDSPVSVAIKQISDTATPLRKINPAVPEALESITEHAMAKDPLERYQSATAMLADIDAFKRNPSVKFEYQYLTDTNPTRYIDKVVNKTAAKTPDSRSNRKPAPQQRAPKRAPAASGATRTQSKRSLVLPILAGVSIAFAIGAAILVFMIFKASGSLFFNQRADVELPNFHGMSRSEIEANTNYVKTFDLVFEENYRSGEAAGIVYDQSPKAPKTVKEGTTVTLRVSKGTELIFVPDVTGWEREQAIDALKEAGLNVMVRPEVSDSVAEGRVIRTEAAAGQQVASGDTISLYVSQEERIMQTYLVPDCIGLSKEAAKTLLDKNFLTAGAYTEVQNDAPAGTIIGQSPEANVPVPYGTAVYFQVSTGHTHVHEEGDIIIPATCQTEYKGTRWMRCACGDAYEAEYTLEPSNPDAHSFMEGQPYCLFGCGTPNPNYHQPDVSDPTEQDD